MVYELNLPVTRFTLFWGWRRPCLIQGLKHQQPSWTQDMRVFGNVSVPKRPRSFHDRGGIPEQVVDIEKILVLALIGVTLLGARDGLAEHQ